MKRCEAIGRGGEFAIMGAAALLAAVGAVAGGAGTAGAPQDDSAMLPNELTLTGVVRDFKERTAPGGHTDFERQPSSGFAHYAYICADRLGADGKPVFASTGRKVTTEAKDAQGRQIAPPREHVASRPGDRSGAVASGQGGAVVNAASFAQWWRDAPGVTMSRPLGLTLKRRAGSNVYTFDDKQDAAYQARGGFFPINGELWGNSGGATPTKNFHFTFELDTVFLYRRGSGQVFTFTGDDDVFVFVDGRCVIDIGGVHTAVSQTIDLDRLGWLEDGRDYSLKFFFAERHRTQSNFRIETTITLKNAPLPMTSALYD